MHPILYERRLPDGPAVRIRVTTPAGAVPLRAILELERRTSSARAPTRGRAPLLAEATADTERELLAALAPYATDDDVLRRLVHERGLEARAQ